MSLEQRLKEYKKVTEKVTEKEKLVIGLIEKNKDVTIQEIAKNIKISRKSVNAYIKQLKEKGLLQRVGPDKGGHWKIIGKYSKMIK